jgi:tetratricopeptide (TPR) repeat protein
LELGARWALKDNVTILICQDTSDIRFNANDNRAIEYGWKPKELQDAITRITETALYGLRNPGHVDSPVREASDQILVSRLEHEALHEDLESLRHHQAEDLIDAALRSTDLQRRVELLEQATLRNPASWRAYFELGATLRREGRYAEAEAAFRTVIGLKDDFAPAWRELGMTLGKAGTADEDAVLAFDRALILDGRDAETWATQGGLFRRLARRRAPGSIDVATLERALACYERANHILPKNLYSLMNAARVKLLLAGLHGTDTDPPLTEIGTLELLARYNTASDQTGEPWARIDLAYALLLSGRAAEGVSELRTAASAIAVEGRAAALAVEAEVLGDFLIVADALPPQTVTAIRSAIDVCEELSNPSSEPLLG